MITVRGETFKDTNVAKRTPNHPTKSHAVLAEQDGKRKLIRFGQQNVSGVKKPKTEKDKKRRMSFFARHKKNINSPKKKFSAAFWAAKTKWSP
jgi:hypothetical protein